MSSDTLSRAYELIEANQLEEAQRVLEPLITPAQDNPDVWWVYAHAVTSVDEAEEALNNVLRLDPSYPGAAELKNKLEQQKSGGAQPAPTSIKRLGSSSAPEISEDEIDDILSDLDDESGIDGDFDLDEGEEQAVGRTDFLRLFLIIVVLAVVLIGGFLLLSGGGDDDDEPDATPTTIAGAQTAASDTPSAIDDFALTATAIIESAEQTEPATEEATDTQAPTDTEEPTLTEEAETPTEEPATPTEAPTTLVPTDTVDAATPVIIDETTMADVLAESFELAGETTTEQTTLGMTFTASVCTEASTFAIRDTLNQVMATLATENERIEDDVEAVGVRLVDCQNDRTRNFIAVTLSDAIAFAEGAIDEPTFRSRWQPVG